VRPDMAVVAWGGAVGRVVSVEKDFARVRLLSDPNSGAAGVVARSRAEGILVGHGSEPMEMRYVPKYADVVVGTGWSPRVRTGSSRAGSASGG